MAMNTNPYLNSNSPLLRNPEVVELVKAFRYEIQQAQRPASEVILDDVDLREQLKVSARTLALWRSTNLIKYSKVNGKIYYKYSDVLELIEKNSIPTSSKPLKIKL